MRKLFLLTILFLSLVITHRSYAQFDAGADLVSSYIWRGTILADGPSIQPWVSYSAGEEDVTFEIGAWGSYTFFSLDGTKPPSEADLYATLGLGPISITLTDYYFPSSGELYFDYDNGHILEASVGAEFGGLSLLAAINFAGDIDDDSPGIYFEGGYAFDSGVSVFAGLGDEFYLAESFGLVNLGLGYEKEILGGLPAFGQVILNPEAESFGIVFGVSF